MNAVWLSILSLPIRPFTEAAEEYTFNRKNP